MNNKIGIIGSGPAGLTAAIYAARSGAEVTVFMGDKPFGQLMYTTEVENFPGFADGISGPDLVMQMKNQGEKLGVKYIDTNVDKLKIGDNNFILISNLQEYEFKSCILATGSEAKWLGLESEKTFQGKGISTCATCDGFFYKGKTVAVIGGGNTAVEEALFLSNIAEKVILIHRRDTLRAEKIMQNRLLEKQNVEYKWNTEVQEFYGKEEKLNSVLIKNSETGDLEKIDVDGVFVAIGYKPQTDLVKGILDLDDTGYVTEGPKTKVSGLFVAGDAYDHEYRQAITAAASGCMAAMDSYKFIQSGHKSGIIKKTPNYKDMFETGDQDTKFRKSPRSSGGKPSKEFNRKDNLLRLGSRDNRFGKDFKRDSDKGSSSEEGSRGENSFGRGERGFGGERSRSGFGRREERSRDDRRSEGRNEREGGSERGRSRFGEREGGFKKREGGFSRGSFGGARSGIGKSEGGFRRRERDSEKGDTGEFKKTDSNFEAREGGSERGRSRFGEREGGFKRREGGFGRSGSGFGRREGGFQKREGGFRKREGDFVKTETPSGEFQKTDSNGGFRSREGGFKRREGGFGRSGSGFGRREGGFQKREGGFQKREGGFRKPEGGSSEGGFKRREGGFGGRDGGSGFRKTSTGGGFGSRAPDKGFKRSSFGNKGGSGSGRSSGKSFGSRGSSSFKRDPSNSTFKNSPTKSS